MASISELNIRLGLITKDFSKKLKEMEGQLRQSGQTMSDLGQRMTLGITAPLVGIGIASVKAAGDMEALQKAMEATFAGQDKTIAEANAELEKLRELALAPGLDFEQAVKGSIRLQNVGYSAEVARDVIEQLANAVALTGGGADDLNEVVNQFSQMIGKGKVFQDDLKIITGRMPVIATLMKNAFGTTTAEGLNKLGISSREFVDIITKAASDGLPRVEGGINNAFVNAGSAARQSMAELGKALITTFDIVGLLNSFSDALAGATKWFSELGSTSQAFIGYSAAVAASLGVGIYAVGQLKLAYAGLVGFFSQSLFPAFTAVKNAILTTRAAFFALSVATQAFVVVGIIAAVTALYFAFNSLVGVMTEATQIEKNLQEVNYNAQKSISDQKVEVDLLTKVLKDNNSTQQERERALLRLNAISPEYFGNLKEENGLIVGLDNAVKGYVGSITRAATAQAAFAKIQALANEQLELGKQASEGATLAEQALDAVTGGAANAYARRQAGLLERVASIKKEQEALEGVIRANQETATVTGELTAKQMAAAAAGGAAVKTEEELAKERAAAKKATDERKKAEDEYWESLSKVNEASEAANEQEQKAIDGAKALLQARERLADQKFGDTKALPQSNPTGLGGFTQKSDQGTFFDVQLAVDPSKAKEAIDSLKQPLGKLSAIANSTGRSIGDSITAAADRFTQAWEKNVSAIYGAVQNLSSGILDLQKARGDKEKADLDAESKAKIETLEQEYASKFAAAKGNADATAALEADLAAQKTAIEADAAAKKDAIDKKRAKAGKKIAIGLAIIDTALGVAKALGSAPPPYNFILAALSAAAGAVQIATIKAQPFADGGVITKPTLGLVGEYAGASSNPEIITPERLMRSIFREESGGANSIQVYGVIKGADIEISNRKAERERGRVR
ncbi:MAG: tape measure protein [Chitinophagaceae bacterium]|nr:tape measure protein [Chitinophagaceae bacterium]